MTFRLTKQTWQGEAGSGEAGPDKAGLGEAWPGFGKGPVHSRAGLFLF
jgi:hypothetical protein